MEDETSSILKYEVSQYSDAESPLSAYIERKADKLIDRLSTYTTLKGIVSDDSEIWGGRRPELVIAKVEKMGERLCGTQATLISIVKSMLGTGILFMPRGFRNAGILAGPLTFFFFGCISVYCMILLIRTKDHVNRSSKSIMTYPDLGKAAYGMRGKRLVEAALTLSQIGFVCVYIIFMAKNFAAVSSYFWQWDLPTNLLIPLVTLALTPFSLLHSLRDLKWINILMTFLIFSCVGVILIYEFTILDDHPPVQLIGDRYFLFVGTAVYMFEGQSMVLPIHDAMKPEIKDKLPQYLMLTLAFIMALLISFGMVGYLAFGDETASIVTLNLPGTFGSIIQAIYVVAAYGSVPILLFPIVRVFYKKLRNKVKRWCGMGKRTIHTLMRLVVLGIALVISLGAADAIDNIVAVIGGVCCVPLSYIFPASFHLKLVQPKGLILWIDYAIILLGFMGAGVATFEAIYEWH